METNSRKQPDSNEPRDTRNPLFKGLKSLTGSFEDFDLTQLPEQPGELFLQWFAEALRKEVAEPHAITLSTVDHEGRPDARTLILKDVHGETFYFASSMDSRKGRQLHANAYAAVTFYWQAVGRQIRLRGKVIETGAKAGAEDFSRRPLEARVVAMTGRQSDSLLSQAELEQALAIHRERLKQHPEDVSPSWRLYAFEIDEAEFWQADSGRKHTRVQYHLNHQGTWVNGMLWP